ncbi:MAG: sodium:proton exchanger, partial [Chloroflexi bacterium]|nr:sodium:proton exchanger [Chloroflexota bacterium]
MLATFPAVLVRVAFEIDQPALSSLVFGIGIVAAAFLLAWAAEAAQTLISAGLAIAVVALLTILPEYAVDMTFAWKAGADPGLEAYLAGG